MALALDARPEVSRRNLPSGAIASFVTTITSSKRDRDGDELDPRGCRLDPRHPLLWCHSPEQPIGRFVDMVSRDARAVKCRYVLADVPLAHDALKLLELNALRASIGFTIDRNAVEPLPGAGRRIKSFEVMELSLVPVPSNTDCEVHSLERCQKALQTTLGRKLVTTLKAERELNQRISDLVSAAWSEARPSSQHLRALVGLIETWRREQENEELLRLLS